MTTKLSRRAFLAATGAGAALLPLLEADRASACLTTGPRRLVIVHWPNGVSGWPAPAAGAAVKLPGSMTSLETHKADLLFLNKLYFEPYRVNGHASVAILLTGKKSVRQVERYSIADGISIDQHIADGLVARGYKGLPSLNLGVMHIDSSTQWRASQQPVLPDNDPHHVFDTLFGGAATSAADLERLRQQRKSVLDHMRTDLARFQRRLGTADRAKIDAHLSSVREIETQLTGPAAAACQVAGLGKAADYKIDHKKASNFPQIAKLQTELCVAALTADRARVSVIQLGNDSNFHIPASWLGMSDNHHDIAHNPERGKEKLDRWYYETFAAFIAKMKAVTEGDKRLLDNTAILFINNMAEGKNHATGSVPWFMAGGCGGYFKVGRSIETPGPHNRVLIALANAMGVPTETFGNPAFGTEHPALKA